MPLTPHQEEKGNELVDLVRRGVKRINLLGSAGVGKTFLTSELVEKFRRDFTINPNYNNGAIYATAPTNKALAVLQGKIKADVEFKTIHAALKLKRFVNEKTGQVTFVKGYSKPTDKDFAHCKACFIDETSMLNTVIMNYLADLRFPIIFIGDAKQLNPVGEPISPVFARNHPIVELTEIIRQGEGNPIIELSRDLDMINFKIPSLVGGKGYVYSNDKDSIIDALAEVNGTDEMKYLSYMNDDVDKMNSIVRERIYGRNPAKVEKGEVIVFNAPMDIFYTNQELKVEDVCIVVDNVPVPKMSTKFDNMGLPMTNTDYIKMKYYLINGSVKIVHEDSERMYYLILQAITDSCKRFGWSWRGKFFFEEQFADIKYNHAITVHKSQGSTYKQTAINIGNINFNKNIEERQRLLYTAVTRASDLIILNNVK